MIILLYILISHCAFFVQILNGSVISDKKFFESLFWSYCWPIEMFATIKSPPYYERFDKYVDRITEINEKFRNLLYFVLFGVGEETSN